MNTDRWGQLQELFHEALKRPAERRAEFLAASCGDDTALRKDVESLLANEGRADELLDGSAWEPQAGDRIAQYRITGKLGSGGMGDVFRATDERLHREAALKVLPAAFTHDAEWMARFQEEARVLASLNHPHIAAIYGLEETGGLRAMAMELVEGETLGKRLERGPLGEAESLAIARQIAEALQYSHSHGVIHCDLKPANVMVSEQGQVKLLDFGIARRFRRAEGETDSAGNAAEMGEAIAGTIGYMSPEQLRGDPVDHRTDLFAFGVLLYEMVAGKRPFHGETRLTVAEAILHAPPRAIGDRPVAAKLQGMIWKLLEKEPAQRYPGAGEVLDALRELEGERRAAGAGKYRRLGIYAVVLAGVAGAVWFGAGRAQERWARETAMPEINRLLEGGEYGKAAALTEEARVVLPTDPTLARMWMDATGEVSISSEPAGATVEARTYAGDPKVWKTVGKTPLEKVRMPREVHVWRVVKEGYAAVTFLGEPSGPRPPGYTTQFKVPVRLVPAAEVPPEMVAVRGGRTGLAYPLGGAQVAPFAHFLMDRHEVTNRQYQQFVDAGGYRDRRYWKEAFERGGKAVAWDAAVGGFVDSTGKPGPAVWAGGHFPKGQEDYPVAGVSWYEAAAYAAFAGKQLPTAYHWTHASQAMAYSAAITAGSHFAGDGARAVGNAAATSGSGTADMAGNVKEWCANATSNGGRVILGGGFGEPKYMFQHADARSAWARSANVGFRCARFDAPAGALTTAKVEVAERDYWKATPAADPVFETYLATYAYDKGPANAEVERVANAGGWVHEKITMDAAYGRERFAAHLFLPKNAAPPFQTVVYFPGAGAFLDAKMDLEGFAETRGFLVNSGRALVFPIYKGTYERRDGMIPGRNPPAFQRDHQVAWVKDLGRVLDYLETRKEIDSAKIGYLGDSLGGVEGAILPAIEKRIQAEILINGGLQLTVRYQPEADPFHYVRHVRIPVLMLNGRYDAVFPVESSQRPLFQFLGTPATDKRHVIYEAGHADLPKAALIQESIRWLDTYLGPVRR